jgi:tRNA-dihydrouridine synthase 3
VLDNVNRLGKIVVGMSRALGEIPVTVKLRTGVKDNKNTAHKLMPRLAPEFRASAITVGFPCEFVCVA